jgi:uncharacterized protein (TIGR02300 family)
VAKPELGTKRLCANCGTKFYDLSKSPAVCPKCATVFHVAAPARARPEAAAPVPAAPVKPPVKEVVVEPETQEAEFVSLEEADAESKKGAAKGPATDAEAAEGEEEIEMDESIEDAAFIEQQEEGDEDVTDIVGEGREDEEET